MFRHFLTLMVVLAISAPVHTIWAAEGAPPEGTMEEGTGFSLFGTESIKGFDASKVEKDPVCDRNKRPKIFKVEPDEAKPGDKVVIKGRTSEPRSASRVWRSAPQAARRSSTRS